MSLVTFSNPVLSTLLGYCVRSTEHARRKTVTAMGKALHSIECPPPSLLLCAHPRLALRRCGLRPQTSGPHALYSH